MADVIQALLKHAKRYGHDSILETAAEFLSLQDLTKLIEGLDVQADDLARAKLYNPANFKKPRRQPAETRAKKLLGIEDEEEAA